jgi:glycosyltransferase involved in cell wall biosynthesis
VTIDATEGGLRPTVLLVSVGIAYGGAETYYVKLASILRETYVLRAVVCNDCLASEFNAIGVEVVNVSKEARGYRRYTSTARAIWSMRRDGRVQVAHLNGQPEAYLAPLLRLMGYRVVITRHTPFTDQFFREGSRIPAFLKRWIATFCLIVSQRVVCVSQLIKKQLSTVVRCEKLVVIPTWVGDRFLTMRVAPEPSEVFRLLFVGRVVTNKGIFDLVEAVKGLPDVQLDVVGVGDQLDEAKRSTAGLKVNFHGFQEDCIPYYGACDLLVFPAHEGFEGLPQVPLEAMAMGVPCLASNISSVREIAGDDGSTLMLFEAGDADDLARQILRLREYPSLREELGNAGSRRVAENFAEAAVRARYLSFFADAFRD